MLKVEVTVPFAVLTVENAIGCDIQAVRLDAIIFPYN